MKNCFGYKDDDIGYPLEVDLWDSLSFFIMQITPALSYNDLYHMPEDRFFAYYQLSKEKHETELKALEDIDNKNEDKDFIGEEDEDAVDFFEEITGYND